MPKKGKQIKRNGGVAEDREDDRVGSGRFTLYHEVIRVFRGGDELTSAFENVGCMHGVGRARGRSNEW